MSRDDLEIPDERLADVTGGFLATSPAWVLRMVNRKVSWLARRSTARRDVSRWWDALERERPARPL